MEVRKSKYTFTKFFVFLLCFLIIFFSSYQIVVVPIKEDRLTLYHVSDSLITYINILKEENYLISNKLEKTKSRLIECNDLIQHRITYKTMYSIQENSLPYLNSYEK